MLANFFKKLFVHLCFCILWVLVSFLYLWPSPRMIFHDKVIGIAQDEVTLPYYYDFIRNLFKSFPLGLFDGALYSSQISAPAGQTLWIPYVERIAALLSWPFASVEQASFWFVVILHALSGMLCLSIGRRMGLSLFLSFTFGLCFSFTPFTIWRDQVHLALSGVYFLPLMVLGTYSMVHARSIRDWILGGIFWVLCLTSAHYFILVFLSLLPFCVIWIFRVRTFQKSKAIALPLVFVILTLFWIRAGSPIEDYFVRTEKPLYSTVIPRDPNRDWDVKVYSARALDYLSGNSMEESKDPNPIRKWITESAKKEGSDFYPQERASGVRWFLLLLSLYGLYFRKKLGNKLLPWFELGCLLAMTSFLFSLSPRTITLFGHGIMPSQLVHALLPEMRAPNRWSVGVQMGVCLMAFSTLAYLIEYYVIKKNYTKKIWIEFLVLVFAILEFAPTFAFPVYNPVPSFGYPKGCGLGVQLPFRSNDDNTTYQAIASLRHTDCKILNAQALPDLSQYFVNLLGKDHLINETSRSDNWLRAADLLRCLRVEWVRFENAYGDRVPRYCKKLGYELIEGMTCKKNSSTKLLPLKEGEWKTCLKGFQ